MARVGIAALDASAGRKGGVDVYAVGLANALASYGRRHQYTILSSSGAPGGGCADENVSQQSFSSKMDTVFWHLGRGGGCSSIYEFKLTRGIDRACSKHQLDCLHFPATRITVPGVKARAALTFFDMQYAFLPQFFSSSEAAAIDRTYRESINRAEFVVAPTQFTMDSLRERYSVSSGKLVLIPAGIDDSLGAATAEENLSVRGRYGLSGSYIIYPANPWPHKNHERLLKAMKMLLDSKVNIPRLVLTGRLPGKEDLLANMIRELRLTEYVSDLGYVPNRDLQVLMSGATLLVFPSLFEGFGYPVLEAMACGCAVAAANSSCLPETVGDAGILFNPTSVEGIAEAILRLAVRGEGREVYIAKGLAHASRFKWSRVVPLLENLYSRFESQS